MYIHVMTIVKTAQIAYNYFVQVMVKDLEKSDFT